MIRALLPFLWLFQEPHGVKREAMVREQIEARGVNDRQILRILRTIPRHEFMPPAVAELAYEDHPVSIGYGATISQPYIVASMTDLLDVKSDHRVLEIGTGSGYQAAVLAGLAKQVYTIEIVPELATSAAATLKRLGYANVFAKQGDGYKGWPEEAPFDRIILTAAPPELPKALVEQLKPGGKLVAPIGKQSQELIVVDKSASGKIRQRTVYPVRFVPMVPNVQAPASQRP